MLEIRIRAAAAAALLVAMFLPSPAAGYSVSVHSLLALLAFEQDRSWTERPVEPIAVEDLRSFRRWVHRAATGLEDDSLRERFSKRYPSETDLDAWAFKELLAFHGAARVVGIDVAPVAPTLGELISGAVADPDLDLRNIGRLAYRIEGGLRVPLQDRAGRPVPFDPAILNMGRIDQLSSQAHAHYGLAQVEFSSDPEILKSDPRRFAIALGFPDGPVLTLAAEMAQLHTDLALLAALSGLPHADEMGWLFGAQGWHYTQDVGNQVHTVQVGRYEFFLQAQLQYWKRAALTAGGVFGELRPFPAVGILILQNHHLLGEELTRVRLLGCREGQSCPAELKAGLETIDFDDPDLVAAFAKRDPGARGPFALELTRTLIELSSNEGAELYRLTQALVQTRYSEYGVEYRESVDGVEQALRPGAAEADEASRFYGLQSKAFRRVTTALRLWRARYEEALAGGRGDPALTGAVLARLLRQQLDLLDATERRRDAYLAAPPEALTLSVVDWRFAVGESAVLLGVPLFLLGLLRRRGRRTAAVVALFALGNEGAAAQDLKWTSFGAARTVSGSLHVLEWGQTRILLDCGLYFSDEAAVDPEPGKTVDGMNISLPLDPNTISFAVLSHAHLDHSGRLPLLVRRGYRGPIYATPGTITLCRNMLAMTLRYGPLPEELLYRERGTNTFHARPNCPRLRGGKNLSKVKTTRQAVNARKSLMMCSDCVQAELEALLLLFVPLEYGRWEDARPGVRIRLSDAGHIVGAAITEIDIEEKRRVVFSGDLGGQIPLLVKTPKPPGKADTVIVEATYGGAVRNIPLPPYSDFDAALEAAAARGEPVVVISYTLDRTQRVLYLIRRAQEAGKLPKDWPVTMPSPSALSATEAYERLLEFYGERYFHPALVAFSRSPGRPFRTPQLHLRDEKSSRGVFIIPAGLEFSKTGQRILARLLPNPRAHIFSVGYADPDSITGNILAGKAPLIEGNRVSIRAQVRKFSVFSGHADSEEMLGWLRGIEGVRRVLVVHGEPKNCESLAAKLRENLGVKVAVPETGIPFSLQD